MMASPLDARVSRGHKAGLPSELRFEKIWSGRRGSNPRPRPWQGRALPLSYTRIRDGGERCAVNGRPMPNAGCECNSPRTVRCPSDNLISLTNGLESVRNDAETGLIGFPGGPGSGTRLRCGAPCNDSHRFSDRGPNCLGRIRRAAWPRDRARHSPNARPGSRRLQVPRGPAGRIEFCGQAAI